MNVKLVFQLLLVFTVNGEHSQGVREHFYRVIKLRLVEMVQTDVVVQGECVFGGLLVLLDHA